MSHCRNASTVNPSGFLFDHDHDDANCMMSYPLVEVPRLASIPPTGGNTYEANRLHRFVSRHIDGWPDVVTAMNDPTKWSTLRNSPRFLGNFGESAPAKIFRPHFCGRCNLKLRGWDIFAAVADSKAPPALAPPRAGGVPGAPALLPMGGPKKTTVKRGGAGAAAAPAFNWDDPANLDPVTSGHPDLLPVSSRLPIHKQDRINRQYPVDLVYFEAAEVLVRAGDSLCGIAMSMGHKNCYPIWAHPRNAPIRSQPIVPAVTQVFVPRRKADDKTAPAAPPVIHFLT